MLEDKRTENRPLQVDFLLDRTCEGDKRIEDRTLLGRHLVAQDMLGGKRTQDRPLQVDILLDRTCWETREQRISLSR